MSHILVIKLGALGDFIQALGPMRAIREAHKHDKITLLTTQPFAKMGAECGYFDDILIDVRPKWYQVSAWIELVRALNAGQYARVYDLQNNDRTGHYFRLMDTPKPEWVGIAKGASHRNLSDERTAGNSYQGHVNTLALVGMTGVSIDRLEWMHGDFPVEELNTPYVLMMPGCAPSRPEKRWPAVHYADIAKELVKQGFQPVLIGTQDDYEAIKTIQETGGKGIVSLLGRTSLFDIAALARHAAFCVGNDTGPIHLAAATGCPTLVLFNLSKSSNPVRHAPNGENVHILAKDPLATINTDNVLDQLKTLRLIK
ncbi:MAG: glycosyltransferase family 9 protein [Pseudobdellovibrionaceae bacterium]